MWHVCTADAFSCEGGERPNDHESRQVLAEYPWRDSTGAFLQLPLSPPVEDISRYIVFFSRTQGKDLNDADCHPDQPLRGTSRRGGTLPPGVARSRRAPAAGPRLSPHPSPPFTKTPVNTSPLLSVRNRDPP